MILIAGCSIEISDATPTPAATSTSAALPTPTLEPPISASPSPTALPWADLGLSGRLYFLTFQRGGQELVSLDLASGDTTTVFAPEDRAWLTAADVSPDGTQIVMAFAPPPEQGEVQFGYTDLYLMPVGAPSRLSLLMERPTTRDAYFNPLWSPGGDFIYFAHSQAVAVETGITFKYTVERVAYPNGEPEVLVEDAFWPRLSSDGSRLAYITFDTENYTNDLYVADADGSDPVRVVSSDEFVAVDAPLFSPDNSRVIFSAVSLEPAAPAARNDIDKLLGARSASAHSVPSDWWSAPIDGSAEPERLTAIFDTNLYGDLSPDGEQMVFVSTTGLFVMKPDGTNLQRLLEVWAGGTVAWQP